MRNKLIILLALGALFALLLPACTLVTSEPETCDGEGILFEDEFDGERDCGWVTYSRAGATVQIVDGALQVNTSQPGQLWWSNPGKNFDDQIITAEARQVEGPDDNAYGLICRYQNEENFYLFLISGDGYYAIGKYQSGSAEVEYLTADQQFQPSDAINQGNATNRIEASCIGNELSLAVNGLALVTVTDPTFVTGDIGVAASTLQPGTSLIEFDSIRVRLP
jgi:hypothetical protein